MPCIIVYTFTKPKPIPVRTTYKKVIKNVLYMINGMPVIHTTELEIIYLGHTQTYCTGNCAYYNL